MKNRIIIILITLFLGGAVTIENSDKAKETLSGFSNMRGFSTLSDEVTHGSLVVGGTASGSAGTYLGEFTSTGTVSLNFQGTSANKGTCFQLQNTTGTPVYARVVGTTFTINTLECRN